MLKYCGCYLFPLISRDLRDTDVELNKYSLIFTLKFCLKHKKTIFPNYPFDMLLLIFVYDTIAVVAHCDIEEYVTSWK